MKLLSNSIVREKAVYEDLICIDVPQSSGEPVHFIANDILLLFNQQRLESLGQTAMIQYLNSIAPKSDALRELRSKCSDDELISLVKSRHIQSRSDLLAWSKYLDLKLDDTKAELERIRSVKSGETIKFNDSDNSNSSSV